MGNRLIVKNEILINAEPSKVWDALTDSEHTQKYMYGCKATSDWEVGTPLLWKGMWEHKEMIFVKGNIISIDPGASLAYTTFDPNNTSVEDVPENYLTVTYDLTPQDGKTVLVVTQGDYTNVPNGEHRYNEAVKAGGWSSILEQIKTIVEAGN